MFTIEWLHRVEKVDSTTFDSNDIEDAVHGVRKQAADMATKHPGKEPDNFRIMDASGAEVGTYAVSDSAYDGETEE